MRALLRSFAVHTFVLWLISTQVGGIDYGGDTMILALGSFALTLIDLLLKPFINILLLPFNLITLGAFRWISSTFTLYITTLLVPRFSLTAFTYKGLQTDFFIIPQFDLSLLGAYILIGVLISFLVSLFFWLIH